MTSIAIIEDNLRYREFLKTMIMASGELTLAFEREHARDLLHEARKHRPDVVIMDIDLPGRSGIEATLELKEALPDLCVLILTVFEDEEKIFNAIKAGANGYLLKKDPPQKILDAIEEVKMGKSPMNGWIARKVLEFFQKKTPVIQQDDMGLTRREKEILELLMEGLTYKEIAARCFISVQTLNSHIKNTYAKLGVHSRAEIAARFRK